MGRIRKLLLISVLIFLAGCVQIDYPEIDEVGGTDTDNADDYDEENLVITELSPLSSGESKTKLFEIGSEKFTLKKQFEDIDPARAYRGLYGYEGSGYVQLDAGESVSFEVEVSESRHYRLGLSICTHNTVVVVNINGIDVGAYNITEAFSFDRFSLDGFYLEKGTSEITLSVLEGICYFDYYMLLDTNPPLSSRFEVSRLPANKNASTNTVQMLNLFGELFGKRIFTAQHCTPNSDAELNAVYAVTGRYPAIRAGDLSKYSRSYSGDDKSENCEIELAEAWAEKGGIVSFSWTWYEPVTTAETTRIYSSQTTFELNKAFTTTDIALLDREHIQALADAGAISYECLNIILDIDDMAENLKRLRDKDIPVLWRPLPEAGTGWFWWGDCLPESFVWLWRLMFQRMSEFHELDNLIWVWNGADYDFYPGDEYVDIIGEDIYNMSDTSNLPAFNATLRYSVRRKFAAMTECGLIPDPDILKRDNAMWLWFGLYKGDYIVVDNGLYFSEVNTKQRLNHAYNHELTITLDELNLLME